MDSIIGYKNEKYLYFGRAAARLDDVLGYIPARITGILFVFSAWLLGFDHRNAWRVMQRDAGKHPSPNGGYAEATVAGALHIRLGGFNTYFGRRTFRAYMGDVIEYPHDVYGHGAVFAHSLCDVWLVDAGVAAGDVMIDRRSMPL